MRFCSHHLIRIIIKNFPNRDTVSPLFQHLLYIVDLNLIFVHHQNLFSILWQLGCNVGLNQGPPVTIGKYTRKSVPLPGSLSKSICPPHRFTIPWVTESPIPVPSPLFLVVKNGLNLFPPIKMGLSVEIRFGVAMPVVGDKNMKRREISSSDGRTFFIKWAV